MTTEIHTVTVVHHREDGVWWFESADIPGWSGAADSLQEARLLASDGVRFALETNLVRVRHALGTSAVDYPGSTWAEAAEDLLRSVQAEHVDLSDLHVDRSGSAVVAA